MSFEWPQLLWSLVLVPLASVAYVLTQRRRSRYVVRFTNLDLLANLVPRSPSWRRHVPPALAIVALGALLLGVARPSRPTTVPREDAVVVLAMDRSGSMTATDVAPSRMDSAKAAAKNFVRELPNAFRVGVVGFETEVEVMMPPTSDRGAVQAALEELEPGDGTALGDAIAHSLEVGRLALAERGLAGGLEVGRRLESGSPLTVLLLSDGENTQGTLEPLAAARRAQALGVPVFTIALGTPRGTIEIPDGEGSTRALSVPPDPTTLKAVAEMTGGEFFAAPRGGELRSIYERLGVRVGHVDKRQEVTWLLAAAGGVLLLAASTLSLRWFNRIP